MTSFKTVIAGTSAWSALALASATPALAEETDHAAHNHEAGEIHYLLEESASEAGSTTPTMSFGEWGFDPNAISADIHPGDDFFAYANKKWLDANPLPAEFSRFGAFTLLGEKSTSDVKALIDELVAKAPATLTSDEKRIVDAHNAFLDTDAIDAAGLASLPPLAAA